jgi:hypothetical protein
VRRAPADYTGTMDRRRSPILLLVALAALLVLPASASAAIPTNETPDPPAGGWVQSGYDVTPDGDDTDGDPIDLVEWTINGDGPHTGPLGTTLEITGGPIVQLTTRVQAGGEWSDPKVDTYNVDDTAPIDMTTSDGLWKPGPVNIPLVGDSGGTSPIVKFQYRFDPLAPPTDTVGIGPWTVPVVADGTHTLYTRAFDMAGNISNWKSNTVRIDTQAPFDDTAVSAAWNTTSPVPVTVTGSDALSGIQTVRWRLGTSGPFTDVAGTSTVAPVTGDGVKTLQTQVVDVAGHTSIVKSHTISIDTTAPSNLTAAAPSGWRDGAWPVTVQGADDGSHVDYVEWSVDGSPFTQGSPTANAVVSGHGTHILTTRVWDVAGNSTEREDTIRIDMVDPENTTPLPPAGDRPNPYQVTVSGDDHDGSGIQKVEWRVDGGDVQTGAQATVVGHGHHTLETRVVDNVGRTSGWRADEFDIDAITGDDDDPVDTTTTAPAGWRPIPIPVTVSAHDNGGSGVVEVQWRLDGQAIKSSLVDNPSFTIAGNGEHLLETWARDDAGNVSETREQTFRIDGLQPVDATTAPAGWQDSNVVTLSATDAHSGIQEIRYQVDGGAWQIGVNDQQVPVGADGEHTITTRVFDNANQATSPKTTTVKVDTVDPVNTSDPVPGTDWLAAPLELELSGTDLHLDTIQWRVDGGTINEGGPAVVDTDGVHTLETQAIDEAGNVSGWRSDTVSVDTTAPVNTTPQPAAGWRRTPYAVVVAGEDGTGSGVDKIERTIDGGAVSEDENVTVTGDGVHTLRSRIVDNVGHMSDWRDDVIKIDSVAPTAAISCTAGTGGWSPAAVACTVSADGGPSGVSALTLTRDGAGAGVANGSAVQVGEGVHTLALAATDGAGNHGAAQTAVYVDVTAPAAALSCSVAGSTHTCRADASDATSGLASVAYSVDGGAYTTIDAGGSFTLTKGKVTLRAVDTAGHATVTTPVTLTAPKSSGGAGVKVSSVPVYLAGHKDVDAMLGALNAVRSENGTVSLDLRPLAVGRGRYRVEIAIKAGKRSKRFKRTYKVGSTGTLPRIAASLSKATARCTVKLTVRKRVGRRWRRHAATRLVLAK